jgi:hypothetical protein
MLPQGFLIVDFVEFIGLRVRQNICTSILIKVPALQLDLLVKAKFVEY